jgi:alanyl-tRNA synthetase
MVDQFRQHYPEKGIVVLGTIIEGRPVLIAGLTDDLAERGLHAGDLVKFIAAPLGGSGGGRPTLAQAGGKYPDKLSEAMAAVEGWIANKSNALE